MASYVVLCTMLLAVMANAQAPAPQPTQKLDVEGQKLNLITDNVGKLSQTSGYTLFFRSGDKVAGSKWPMATLFNNRSQPLFTAPEVCTSVKCVNFANSSKEEVRNFNREGYDISFNPDFSSIIVVNGTALVITQYEAPVPAVLYITEMQQNPTTGQLTPKAWYPTDWSAPELAGLWVPCAGSLTPWNTHAGGEEYEPDAYCIEMATDLFNKTNPNSLTNCTGGQEGHIVNMMRYFGYEKSNLTIQALKQYFNPYKYGHAFEVKPLDTKGGAKLNKWYTMGRHSYEMWYVMPDNKTVYSTDDGANTAFWKFVADKPGDMSSGTLYGAKFYQNSDLFYGDFEIDWIELGKATQAELQAMVDKTKFSDIFDLQPYNKGCPPGYRAISKRDNGRGATCLQLKPGMEKAAAFFEPRRYLAYLNGTVEFSKWEGFTFDPVRMRIYTAMSQIRNGMEDNKAKGKNSTDFDIGGPNDIRVQYNPCGCVYYIDVDPSYDAYHMAAEVCGASTNPVKGDTCDHNGISEPDNVAFIPTQDSLLIGEDTNERQIDTMWQYNLATGELRRILTTPYGAETTNPYWFGGVNGYDYITAAVQHPYGESDSEQIQSSSSTGPAGYVGAWAFKSSDFKDGSTLQFQAIPYPDDNVQKNMLTAANSAYKYMRQGTPFLLIDGNKTMMMMQKPKANGDTRIVDSVAAAGVTG